MTALAASWWPARAVARLPIVVALSGRPAAPQPAHRFAVLGIGLAAARLRRARPGPCRPHRADRGRHPRADHRHPAVGPTRILALAVAARQAPIAIRLALRDLARYQARSGAALAAVSLAIGIAAVIAITAAAQQAHDQTLTGGNLPTNQLVVWLDNPNQPHGGPGVSVAQVGSATSPPNIPEPAVVASARTTADAIAAALGAGPAVELDVAENLSDSLPAGAPPDAAQASLVHPITGPDGQYGWTQLTTPFVATSAVLDLYGIHAADIAANTDVISSRRDLAGIQLGTGVKADFRAVTVQVSSRLPNYTSAPNSLLTTKAMAANGLAAVAVGWLVQSPRAITTAQIADARSRAAVAGITVETRTGPDDSRQHLRDYSTLAGLLVALAVLAMTVGLIRSETAGDLRTLAATGASGTTRRTLNATSAAALALLGAILGTAAAYLALIAWHWHDVGYLDQPPYLNLAVLLVGLPIAAALGAWVFGRAPRTLARRPLE